ncbi:MAG: hypothetical protein JWM05_25, partial [Acidimicrobiales bacterium]|nr:hypothetical protein [Acidimicrobiales bacterium]
MAKGRIGPIALGAILTLVAGAAPLVVAPMPPAAAVSPAPAFRGCLASVPFELSTCDPGLGVSGGYGSISTLSSRTVRLGATTKLQFASGVKDWDTPTSCGDMGCIYPGISWRWPSQAKFAVIAGCGSRDEVCEVRANGSGHGGTDSGEDYTPIYAQLSGAKSGNRGEAYALFIPPEMYRVVNYYQDSTGKPLPVGIPGYPFAIRSGTNPNGTDCVTYDAALFVTAATVPPPDCVKLNMSGWKPDPAGLAQGASIGYLRTDSGIWTIKTFESPPSGALNVAKPIYTSPTIVVGNDDLFSTSKRKPAPDLVATLTPAKDTIAVGETMNVEVAVTAKGDGMPLTEVHFLTDTIVAVTEPLQVTGTAPAPFVLGVGETKKFTVTIKGVAETLPTLPAWVSVWANGKNEFDHVVTAAVNRTMAVTPGPPSPDPFATFDALVTRQWTDFCRTAPTAAQLAAWKADLASGAKTLKHLADLLRGCPDQAGRVDPVLRLYRAYFLRLPDTGGVSYWIGRRRAGTSLDAISAAFATSSEFKTRYGPLTNRKFVELVYQNVLGRAGDSVGLAHWTSLLDLGTKT